MILTYEQLLAAVDKGLYVACAPAPAVPGADPILHVTVAGMDREVTLLAYNVEHPELRFAVAYGAIRMVRKKFALPV
jgi:hypothetical protein